MEDGAALLVGFDGLNDAVAWQLQEADRLCQKAGRLRKEELAGRDQERAWEFVRHFPREVFPEAALAIKVGVLPSQCVQFIEQAAKAAEGRGLRAAFSAHAPLGLILAALAASPSTETRAQVACLSEWRKLAGGLDGHLLVESAPLAIKEEIAVWDPPGPAFRIMERLKAQLDPYGILNPGRFVGSL
jgi:glycolate oxidase FAD binding subunit